MSVSNAEQPASWIARGVKDLNVEAGYVTEGIEILLESTRLVEGYVKSMESGEPLSDACLVAVHPVDPAIALGSCWTDESGRYQLGLSPGRSELYFYATPKGYAPMEGERSWVIDVLAGPGAQGVIDIRLTPDAAKGRPLRTGSVKGRVLDLWGKALEGIYIRDELFPSDGNTERAVGGFRLGATDKAGGYEVRVEAGRKHRIRAGGGPHSANATDWFSVKADTVEQMPDLVVARNAASLVGVVTEPNGTPISGATVEIEAESYLRLDPPAKTDLGGGFRIENLPNGEVGLRITCPGYRSEYTRIMTGIEYEIALESNRKKAL